MSLISITSTLKHLTIRKYDRESEHLNSYNRWSIYNIGNFLRFFASNIYDNASEHFTLVLISIANRNNNIIHVHRSSLSDKIASQKFHLKWVDEMSKSFDEICQIFKILKILNKFWCKNHSSKKKEIPQNFSIKKKIIIIIIAQTHKKILSHRRSVYTL